ncbi:UDP-N-acetylmuramoyl-L-alanine--D-glutamate ligase [Myxococcota bacterium]|nr:UDP-N-acetylmuramoyl-L-alanine--D-glutamate ligase [Myxococcota bacterium]MBU1430514.1 UDP-N-acetylmuramoyl-L-alanine--D-glutamate ligase [Myxococcota bacterium]MBU1900145.1 UDP-N-acetylmuramoyl-L-alanine--D-glutamate ligase [Myxococcota bacterium]
MPERFLGREVAVWGAARTGKAAAQLLVDLGARVSVSDLRDEGAWRWAAEMGLRRVVGRNALDEAEVVILSPGIPPSHPDVAAARAAGVRLMSEIELAALACPLPIVAVTGTDGKSTTTEMIAATLNAGGRRAVSGGNIGVALSQRVLEQRRADRWDVIVAEVSAFQLWSAERFSPVAAVMTNIAEDHLEYFEGDAAAYLAAKARVFKDMAPGSVALLRRDDPVTWGLALPQGVRRLGFGPTPAEDGLGLRDGQITLDGRPIAAAGDVPLPGAHNLANAQAAFGVGLALGVTLDGLLTGLRAFKGLPHRLELIPTQDGLRWYDDSKATNPHAAAVGLRALPGPRVVITGGYDKGLSLTPFFEALGPLTRAVILYGDTSARVAEGLAARGLPAVMAEDMAQAVAAAAAAAEAGDAVIFAPAASSFDHYESYAQRGEAFASAVRARLKR